MSSPLVGHMDPERRSHHALAELAGRQHGVVSVAQLGELGYSEEWLRRARETGRLHRAYQSVYAVGHRGLSRQGSCLAAVLSCGDGALLSHKSAAWLWGLTARFAMPVEVTAASPRRTRTAIRVHSAEALTLDDRISSEGIPVTAVPPTLLDFAAVDPWYLGQALDNARRQGLLDLIAIDVLMARSRGFRGVARLRQALTLHRSVAFTRSGVERQFIKLVRRAGLPQPSMNLRRRIRAGCVLGSRAFRGRTRHLRLPRVPDRLRGGPAAPGGPEASWHRDDQGHRRPNGSRTHGSGEAPSPPPQPTPP